MYRQECEKEICREGENSGTDTKATGECEGQTGKYALCEYKNFQSINLILYIGVSLWIYL